MPAILWRFILMDTAPIAFFSYKRPDHTLKALTALSECPLAHKSVLYIFCDGPKCPEDLDKVNKVREVVAERKWCKEVNIIAKDRNVGLAASVIEGVSRLCDEFGRVIVIEDDLIVARGFLEYMNRALRVYAEHPRVMQISGHCFPFNHDHDDESAFFMPISTSWGWSTWKRAWDCFAPAAEGYRELDTNRELKASFDLGGISPYSQMLLDQMSGKIDSWAIRWWWAFFRNNGICLYPAKSLVRNIGFGEGASHTTKIENYHDDPHWSPERKITVFPVQAEPDEKAFQSLKAYFRTQNPVERRARIYARRIGSILLRTPIKVARRCASRFRRILGRMIKPEPSCIIGDKTVFYPSANVINALGKKDNIVIGANCHIKGEFFLFGHGGRIELGDYCYLGDNSRVWSAKRIRIGHRVLISHNCNIFDNDTHPLDPDARHRQFVDIITTGHPKVIDLKEEEVIIEDDVLIGANATVLKGVTLGRGAIVAAGSVVTRNVPPFTIVAGNPARIVRELPFGGK